MKQKLLVFFSVLLVQIAASAQEPTLQYNLTIKTPGNPSTKLALNSQNGMLVGENSIPLDIKQNITTKGNKQQIELIITAKELTYYNLEQVYQVENFVHEDCLFYMPGFWYRRNLRSPKEAPSWYVSDSWQVREDRLSTPLTGIFDDKTKQYVTVLRIENFHNEAQPCHTSGEVILSGKTELGYTGFRNIGGKSALVFGFPYSEAPNTYIRKLTLDPSVITFEKLDKGESRKLVWEIVQGKSDDYASFVADVWKYSYDTYKPVKLDDAISVADAKKTLSHFFKDSYVDKYPLKYYSGVHMRTDDCKNTGSVEVGFVGRVLLNAFNALEYGEEMNRPDLVSEAQAIFDSYLAHGFTSNGFFREFVDYTNDTETDIYSIRRQSEGVFAVLNYLEYEKRKGNKHQQWEQKISQLLDNFIKLQEVNGSFPRKFNEQFVIIDETGGSTPSATLPLTMAYKFFNDKKYLDSAKRTAKYLETELISKSDYFSSTLDANCEDKEASLYASTAMYYLSMVSKGKERAHYVDMSLKSAYFCLSWYYMWDVPFAQGQMLGDVNFKSRGWGNVSVENNHIDVFIFEFATVLDWLAQEYKETRFSEFSEVIRSSMLQLMPTQGHMFNIGKVGYYPEVVQHTNWDYGKNGKGFYNDIFAPGWTVASLWQMLSPNRIENFFNKK